MSKEYTDIEGLHSLLKRQMDRIRKEDGTIDMLDLIKIVNLTYTENDRERRLSDNTMARMSEELTNTNKDLMRQTQDLKRSEERYALASQAANDGLWEWDLSTGEVYYSRRWKEMVGLDPEIPLNSIESWFERIHDEDYDAVQKAMDTYLDKHDDRIDLEYRIRHEDGYYIWASARGLASYNQEDTLLRIAGSQTDITERKQQEEVLRHAAFHDVLTGLSNRALLLDRLSHVIDRVKREGEKPAAVLFIDLDRFKFVNDTMGHDAGDQLLKIVASILKSSVRPGDTVSRMGGDEFALLLNEVEGEKSVTAVARRVLTALEQPHSIKGRTVDISASIGIFMINNSEINAEEILRNSDLAMYHAKTSGKGRYEIFGTEQHRKILESLEIETNLSLAIKENQLVPFYQPIIEIDTGHIHTFEALVRWIHPEKGMIMPGDFIPVAEKGGLIFAMGEYMLHSSCQQLSLWNKAYGEDRCPNIAINFSVSQLLDDAHFQIICTTLSRMGNLAKKIEFEVTESVIMTDPDLIVERLEQLKKTGIYLSIDDFGTGYSSLSYLHKFPFDILKIDRSFVSKISNDATSLKLIKTMIGLAEDMHLKTIAEGVETSQQFKMLREMGCPLAQGYFFASPMSGDDATKLLADRHTYDVKSFLEMANEPAAKLPQRR